MNDTIRSRGHVAYIGGFEFYLRDNLLYRARVHDVISDDGFRRGEWVPGLESSAIALRLERLRIEANAIRQGAPQDDPTLNARMVEIQEETDRLERKQRAAEGSEID
jgi:hypothetical protein